MVNLKISDNVGGGLFHNINYNWLPTLWYSRMYNILNPTDHYIRCWNTTDKLSCHRPIIGNTESCSVNGTTGSCSRNRNKMSCCSDVWTFGLLWSYFTKIMSRYTQLFLPMAASVLHIVMWRRLVHPPTHNKEGLKAGTAMGWQVPPLAVNTWSRENGQVLPAILTQVVARPLWRRLTMFFTPATGRVNNRGTRAPHPASPNRSDPA